MKNDGRNAAPSDNLAACGRTLTIQQWADELHAPVQTILSRLKRGKSPEAAVTTPVGKHGGANRGKKLPAEILTPEELLRLIEKCGGGKIGVRNQALVVLGWRAGLRISEALELLPKDLDRTSQTIRVLHGKGNKSRAVGLDQKAWQFLEKWIAIHSELNLSPAVPLFCTLKGGQINDRYIRALMSRLAKQAGIAKRVHFHGLRHTMAFELASEGVPLHLIQQQLGHSNLAITSRYISHLNPAETIAAMKSRNWDQCKNVNNTFTSSIAAPGWLDRLRSEIGDRLQLIHDARTDPDQFKAVILLF